MLNDLLNHLPEAPPRSILKYRNYISKMQIYTDTKVEQYLHGNNSSYPHGMRLLDLLCHMIDIPYMTRFTDDIERYMFYVTDLRDALIERYDTTHTGSIFRRYYIAGSHTKEFMVSNADINTLKYLPFNKGWDVWKDVPVMKVWWHDSGEFSLNLNGSRIRFYENVPSNCVVLMDPIALVFKWYKFQMVKDQLYPEITMPNLFFYKNFIYNTFHHDLTDIWLLKQIQWLIGIDSKELIDTRNYNDIEVESQYGKITTTYGDGMHALYKEFELVKNNNIKAPNIVNSKLLLNKSIRDLVIESQTRWYTDQSKSYLFLTILKEIDLFELVFDIFNLNPKSTNFKTFLVEFKRTIKRLKNTRPWTVCKHHDLREYIELRINTLYEKIYTAAQ